MDREKVIKGLEDIQKHLDTGYSFAISWKSELIRDVLALLKEQEAVSVHDPGAYCPKCGWMLYPEDHPHHCGNCGQEVKWE